MCENMIQCKGCDTAGDVCFVEDLCQTLSNTTFLIKSNFSVSVINEKKTQLIQNI